jgi:hypothetical protein
MEMNWLALLVAAIVPMVTGAIWYNQRVFGNAWMKATGVTRETPGASMPVTFGLSFFFSFLLAMALQSIVIHQMAIYSVLMNEPGLSDPTSEIGKYVADFMAKYGNNFRTFKHGALHGTIAGIFIALPILGVNALFERKGARYILINVGYWTVTLALMGGVICGWK